MTDHFATQLSGEIFENMNQHPAMFLTVAQTGNDILINIGLKN